jgi:glycine cleavage system H protein
VNEDLADDPEIINGDPYGSGWIVRLRPTESIDEEALLSPIAYQDLLDEENA